MPYTSANLPDHVKALGAKAQRQWMHVANGCIADGKDDGACIRMANGVVKKSKDAAWPVALTAEEEREVQIAGEKYYQYVDSYEYSERAVSQATAGYNPVGGNDTQACANCQWFLAPSRCAVVAGTISPTGVSNLWRAVEDYVPAPIPVTIVDAAKATAVADGQGGPGGLSESWQAKFKSFVSQLFVGSTTTEATGARSSHATLGGRESAAFTMLRQKDGRLRFFAAHSNNFMDREGEVFPEYAHKEFVAAAWAGECDYPELWLWHTPGSKYGQVDWMDVSNGFICSSGLIDSDKEVLAEQLAEEGVGLSHGFYGLQTGNEIRWYRSYEISTLPLANAAVWTTSFNLLGGDKEMAFTADRKSFLKQHGVSDEQLATFEANAKNLSDSLRGLGVAYKDTSLETPPEPAPAAPATSAAAAPAAAPAPAPAEGIYTAADKAADAAFRTTVLDNMNTMTEAIAGLAAKVKELSATDDSKLAAALQPRATPVTNGAPASQSPNNVVSQKQMTADQDFFGKQFLGPLAAFTGNGEASPPATT